MTVAFVKKSYALAEDLMQPFERSTFDPSDPKGLPHVLSVSISGPFNAQGSGDTPSRRQMMATANPIIRPAPTTATKSVAEVSGRESRTVEI